MAKNSAKSKGYRKQVEKKPYLSKREIALLCVIIAAVAVAAFFLFRYDDGALKVREGSVMTDGDNWLIVNGSNARGGVRYYKVGEIGEVEGYARTAQSLSTDDNIPEYLFSPAAEGNQVESITVTTSHNAPQALAKYTRTAVESIEGTEMGELLDADMGGRKVWYYIYSNEREQGDVANNAAPANGAQDDASASSPAGSETEAAAEPMEANRFAKSIVGYTDAPRDSSIVIHVDSNSDTAEHMLPDETLLKTLECAVEAVTLTE